MGRKKLKPEDSQSKTFSCRMRPDVLEFLHSYAAHKEITASQLIHRILLQIKESHRF